MKGTSSGRPKTTANRRSHPVQGISWSASNTCVPSHPSRRLSSVNKQHNGVCYSKMAALEIMICQQQLWVALQRSSLAKPSDATENHST
ncbi:unnamed protein product [Cuscuta campestris]|uniref:Uncharacterized protein n=1 Tax=Cuscuta campestris TaxID=132261 RepID=A0A484LWU3_9ASTE|nr:unnamed protein product [Cuscuta campestris]